MFYIIRSDIQLNDKNRLVIRFNRNESEAGNFNTGPLSTLERSSDTFSDDRVFAVQLASYTPRLLNEFRFQITGRKAGEVRTEASGNGPSVTITEVANLGSPIVSGRNVPTPWITQFQDNLTLTSGKHAVKLGVGFNVYKGIHRSNVQSGYTFPNTEAYVRARSGEDPYSYSKYVESFGEPGVPYRATFWNLFVQDDWKATRKLTINYGLRYDIFLPRYEKNDNLSSFDPTIPNPAAGGTGAEKDVAAVVRAHPRARGAAPRGGG